MPWKVPAQVSASVMTPALSPSTLRAIRSTRCRHLGRRAARERHQQDAARIGAVDDQMRDAMGERVGLAGSGAGDDQQRRNGPVARRAMLDGAPLFRIEAFEIGGCKRHGVIVLG